MKQKSIIYLLSLLFPFHIFSQLVITPDSIATALAQNIAGNGVIVSNATINCNGQAVSNFTYAGANLGLTSGIVLTSGLAASATYSVGSFGDPSYSYFTSFQDPNLTTIDPGDTNDVCIVAFDFVPICNSLSITFVFASSEYDGFVCSFNDGFGIFLSGPNPGGGNYNGQNIATLPNGTPVSINNVNNGNAFNPACPPTNSTYFVDNLTTPNMDIAYPGYTTPITSVTPVTPCSTYHMKIAIADAEDWSYDSAVFIEGNSVACQNTPTVTASATPANCSGNTGTATASVTNYTGTPTYSWTPGGQTTASITNLGPGTYSCVVGLQLGCGNITQTVTAVVTQNGSSLTLTTTTVNPSCNGGNNGTATVIIGGGTAPFTTSWNTVPVQTTTTANNLSSGTYSVTVHDSAGCIQTTTAILTDPVSIVATATTTPSTCSSANGTATANVTSGGTAPFSYSWNSTPIQNAQTATGLVAATYTVLITDAHTCTTTATATVNIQGGVWSVTANTPTNVACFNGNTGAASVTINNAGASAFTYTWNTQPVQHNQTATNVLAGTYTCSVADNNGCIQTVTLTISQPTAISTGNFSVTTSKCGSLTGGVTLSPINGGTPPYSYSWNSTPVQTTQNLVNVLGGNYTLTITDAHGCVANYPETVGSTNGLPLSAHSTTEKCNQGNGTSSVTASGTAPYQYLWNTTPPQTTQSIDSLKSGTYVVHVMDSFGCQDSILVNIVNIDDVLNTDFVILPQEEINTGDPLIISIVANQGWALDSGLLSDGTGTITQNIHHTFAQYGIYYATYFFTSINGCKDTVVYPIKVTDYMTLYIPTAFSPNADGTNDYFFAEGTFISSFQMSIFDRWGKLVTTLDNIGKSWDGGYHGNDAPQDVYVYKGTATDVFGRHVSFQGQINLIR